MRFHVPGPERPGRYVLLFRYISSGDDAAWIDFSTENEGISKLSSPVRLPRTAAWGCANQRTAELGTLLLAPGDNRITLTLRRKTPVDFYSAWLVHLPETDPAPSGAFAFRDFSNTGNRITFTAETPDEGFLLLNEIDYPGWQATIDGNPVPIFKADGIFRAMHVSKGTHKIRLQFRPRSLLWGAAGSLATLFLSLFFLTAGRRRERNRPQ